MKIEKKRLGDVVILTFTGELDVYNLSDLTDVMDKLVDQGNTKFILNTHLLKFINSASLGYLVNRWKTLEAQGGALVIAQPSKFMKRTLATIGIPLPVFDSAEEALLHIKKGTGEQSDLPAVENPDTDLTLERTVRFWANEGDAARVGRIVSFNPEGLVFHYAPKDALDPVELGVAAGTTLQLKFAQPFIVQKHFFTPKGKVTRVEEVETDDDRFLSIRVEYTEIDPKDKEYLDDHTRAWNAYKKDLGGA